MGSSYPACAGNGAYLVLLRVGFTQLPRSLRILVSSYLALSPLPTKANALEFGVRKFGAGSSTPNSPLLTHHSAPKVRWAVSFLWHFPYPVKQRLQLLHRTVRITDHPALRSSDFPPLRIARRALMRSGHRFLFDFPLSPYPLRFLSGSPDWPTGLPPDSAPSG
jgi:hypothetical protein